MIHLGFVAFDDPFFIEKFLESNRSLEIERIKWIVKEKKKKTKN